jgi:hypothetical protein
MLEDGNHHFIFSCKGNYLFKQHTLKHITIQKDSMVYCSWSVGKFVNIDEPEGAVIADDHDEVQ